MSPQATDESKPAATAIPLGYAAPDRAETNPAAIVAVVAFFVALASVLIFLIVCINRHGSDDLWPAAIAVAALSAMGAAFGFFITRRR